MFKESSAVVLPEVKRFACDIVPGARSARAIVCTCVLSACKCGLSTGVNEIRKYDQTYDQTLF